MRVLHVFAPSLKTRFSGEATSWKSIFKLWTDPDVTHLALDVEKDRVEPAQEAFNFEYPAVQEQISWLSRLLWIFQLRACLNGWKSEYDLIHFHVLWWGSLLAAHWAKRQGIPTLFESVLLDADTPGGVIKERFGKLQVSLMKDFTRIIAISSFLKSDYVQNGFEANRVIVLTKGVDTAMFHPLADPAQVAALRAELNLPVDCPILLFTGSAIERKGFDVLIRAFIEVCRKFPDCILLIAGPANSHENPSLDEAFIEEQKRLLSSNGLSDQVKFLGLVRDRQVLAKVFQVANVFVFPSRMEGLGYVVLEAMASGLPIVVSDLPVLEEIITSGENGIKVPIGDVAATADAVSDLLEDEGKRMRLGIAARGDALKRFSFQTWQESLTLVYYQILADRDKSE